jgi:hypothetical protein
MSNSAAGPSGLTADQRRELTEIRWIWDKCYALNCDGVHWTAIPAGTDAVLAADCADQLWQIVRRDNAARMARVADGGYWIETQSGPPFYQPPASETTVDSPSDDAA